jgi:hypothetical protein
MLVRKIRDFFSVKSKVNFVVILIILSFVISGLASFSWSFFENKNCFFSIQDSCKDKKIRAHLDAFFKDNNIKQDDEEIQSRLIKRFISWEIGKVMAKDIGVSVSDEYILESIKKDKLFQESGIFSVSKFNNFLLENKLTERRYFKEMKLFVLNNIISSLFYFEAKDANLSSMSQEMIEFYSKKLSLKKKKYHIIVYKKDLSKIKNIETTFDEIKQVYDRQFAPEVKKVRILKIKDKDIIRFRGASLTVDSDNLDAIASFIKEQAEAGNNLDFLQKKLNIGSKNEILISRSNASLWAASLKVKDLRLLEKKGIVVLDDHRYDVLQKNKPLLVDFSSKDKEITVYEFNIAESGFVLPLEEVKKEVMLTAEINKKIEAANIAFGEKNFNFFETEHRVLTAESSSDLLESIFAKNLDNKTLLPEGVLLKSENINGVYYFFCLQKIEYEKQDKEKVQAFIKEEAEKENMAIEKNYNNYIYNKYSVKIKMK